MKTYHHFINGEYTEPAKREWIESMDPYRGEPWAMVPRGSALDVDRAVEAASRALAGGPWSTMTASAPGQADVSARRPRRP